LAFTSFGVTAIWTLAAMNSLMFDLCFLFENQQAFLTHGKSAIEFSIRPSAA
jgi:hypothetical protein